MPLTKRKIDFIKTLINLYERHKKPVHYVDVANTMGISKWTAYDVLNDLEKLGYVKREYYINDDKVLGRSILVYTPDNSAYELINKNCTQEWNAMKELLINIIKKNDESKVIDNFLNENKDALKPLKFCAYVLTTLLLKIKTLDVATLDNVKNSVLMIGSETSVIFFVGIVIGILINYHLKNESQKILDKINVFHQYVKELSSGDKILLTNFLKESLLYI